MKNKKLLIWNLIIIGILLLTFFLKTIPVPVENIEGAKDPNNFVYGGIYWTSGLYQMSVGNLLGIVSFFVIFGASFFMNIYFNKKNEKKI